jgi:hypothetical protein
LEFTASGFRNIGTQFPGFSGPVSGRISWEQTNPGDPIGALTGIDFNLFGKQFTLAEVGVGDQTSTASLVGGLISGIGSTAGAGLADDFSLIVDRVNPAVISLTYVLTGKDGGLWAFPTETSARFVTSIPVPEPAPWALAAGAALAASRRRKAA